MQYKTLVCGGTFDHFHNGHKSFLVHALSLASHVYIGLTTDTYTKEKDQRIESYAQRRQSLHQFFSEQNASHRFTLSPISKNMIPDNWPQDDLEAFLVTKDTRPGAEELNAKRQTDGHKPLIIEEIAFAVQNGSVISSAAIRNGLMDRTGKPFLDPAWLQKPLVLPDTLRAECQKIFGVLLSEENIPFDTIQGEDLITVGDVVSQMVKKHARVPRIAIIDLFVERKRKFRTLAASGFGKDAVVFQITNPAGTLQPGLFLRLNTLFHVLAPQEKPIVIHVLGEEDLTALAVIICAPLNHILLYGQPGQGVVMVKIDEAAKKRAYDLLSQFEI